MHAVPQAALTVCSNWSMCMATSTLTTYYTLSTQQLTYLCDVTDTVVRVKGGGELHGLRSYADVGTQAAQNSCQQCQPQATTHSG
jgi:hypothetical protein